MGVSPYTSSGAVGRVVIDVLCYSTATGSYVGDEIWDFATGKLEANKLAYRRFESSQLKYSPIRVRPATHVHGGGEIPLSSVSVNSSGYPQLNVYKLIPAPIGGTISQDTINFVGQYTGSVAVSTNGAPLAPQPGTSQEIQTQDLDPDNGDAFINVYNSDNYFATSFTASLPDGTDSVYYIFALNLQTGSFRLMPVEFVGDQVSYSSVAVDNDNELALNYTVFSPDTPAVSYADLYDYIPLTSIPVLDGPWQLVASSAPLTSTCNASNACRWGDYTAEVFDYSCTAANAGLTNECYMFWQVTEYTPDGTSEGSNITSLYDLQFSNDTE